MVIQHIYLAISKENVYTPYVIYYFRTTSLVYIFQGRSYNDIH